MRIYYMILFFSKIFYLNLKNISVKENLLILKRNVKLDKILSYGYI